MRNIFDQYEKCENKLTHALICTLSMDPSLIRPFLRHLKVPDIPAGGDLRVTEQQMPGLDVPEEDAEKKGIPDACIYAGTDWAVLFESKVQSSVRRDQLERHWNTAKRGGFQHVYVVAITLKEVSAQLPDYVTTIPWREVYRWFRKIDSRWAKMLVEYMQVFEARMIEKEDYMTQGTLTMFDGIHFDENSPYSYPEARRLIRLLREELRQQKRKDLQAIGVDVDREARSAIKGRNTDHVWDYFWLESARDETQFTSFTHLSFALNTTHAVAAVTVPNGVKGGFRTMLREGGEEQFRSLVATLAGAFERAPSVKSGDAQPFLHMQQRHYPSMSSPGITDGLLEVDLRTFHGCPEARIRQQREWFDAIYSLLAHKRSNIQFGVEMRFRYGCPAVRSPQVVDLFAEAWIAMKPLLDFVR